MKKEIKEIIEKELASFPPVIKTAICAVAMNALLNLPPNKELVKRLTEINVLLPSLAFYVFRHVMAILPEESIIGDVFDVFSELIKENNEQPKILH